MMELLLMNGYNMQYDKKLKIGVTLLLLLVCTAMHGQSTPPEWFTYPKEGEYVGVSVKMENQVGRDCEMLSAIQSALLSYLLQNEMEEVVFNELKSGMSSEGRSVSDALSQLSSRFTIGYELVRMEKDADGRVWVAIKPVRDNEMGTLCLVSLSVKELTKQVEKNGGMDSFTMSKMLSCSSVHERDTVVMDLHWEVSEGSLSDGIKFINQKAPSPCLVQSFMYRIDTNHSLGNVGMDGEKDTLKVEDRKESIPLEWMVKQASAKGYKGTSPDGASLSDIGGCYLLALLDALMKSERYVINPETKQIERKKATKTYATFFYGDECFMFNNCIDGVTK